MILNEFGKKVKSIREYKGISQSQLSDLTGIVREQISRIEHGQINPTLETIAKISVAFKISLSELMDLSNEIIEIQTINKKLKPFVKWAGGKTQIINEIKYLLPEQIKTYYEPFIGGGALFFYLRPQNAVIADTNKELICAYKCFQNYDDYSAMVKEIINHQTNHSEEYYYKIREMDRLVEYEKLPDYVKAARMIYLNKACFNGLYRVNSKGYFNVPSGKYKLINAYDKELFDELYEYFKRNRIDILNDDFENVVQDAKTGDFVYFDPPYDTFEEQKNFTTYTKEVFGKEEQARLARVFKDLNDKGVNIMLSNHNTKYINELYKGFNIHVINAKRSINSKSSGRGYVEEVIITNY